MPDDLCDALALRLGHVQAALGTPPKYVLGGARPLALEEVAHFPLGEAGAVVLADLAIAENLGRFDAMAAEDTAHVSEDAFL